MRFITVFILLFAFNKVSAQTWTQLSAYPGTARDDGSSFVIGNKAYCITGGSGATCNLDGYSFDGATETWSTMASLPAGNERQYCTAWSYNGKGYLLAGVKCDNTYMNDFWEYDPTANTWTPLPAFPGSGRHGAHHFILNNKVYVIGGWDNTNYLKQVWAYDLITQMWQQKNDLPFNGFWRGAAFTIAGTGYIAYGFTNSNNYNHKIYAYNPSFDAWVATPGITLDARKYIGCEVINGKAFFYAGQDSLNAVYNDVKVFDPSIPSLTTQNGIPTNGRKGGMTFVLNNIFYITTGFNANNVRIKETWKTDGIVGIEESEIQSLKFKLYPNPVQNILTVSGEFGFTKTDISVMNQLGQKIEININSAPEEFVINSESLSEGIYFLQIKTDNGIASKRFVVLR